MPVASLALIELRCISTASSLFPAPISKRSTSDARGLQSARGDNCILCLLSNVSLQTTSPQWLETIIFWKEYRSLQNALPMRQR